MSEIKAMKETVITLIKSEYEATGKVPTIATISKQIKGVSRSSFYKYFPQGIGEACEMAGVPSPTKRIVSTAKATKARITEKKNGEMPRITLTEKQSNDLKIWGLMEDKDPTAIVDEWLENYRILKKDYGLGLTDVSRLARLLKDGEKIGLSGNLLLNNLKRFINLGIWELSSNNLNLLISLRNDMIKNNVSFKDVTYLYSSKMDMYLEGYMKCIEDGRKITSKELQKYVDDEKLKEFENDLIAEKIKGRLLLRAQKITINEHQ